MSSRTRGTGRRGPPPIVLLVRHASAGTKRRWNGDDDLRPVDATGRAQSAALADLLTAFDPTRVAAAPPIRCLQTVVPLAERLQLPVRVDPLLGEHARARDPAASARAVRRQADCPASVACSQGGLIADVLANSDCGHAGPGRPPSRKASVWVLAFAGDRALPAAYLSSPFGWTPSRLRRPVPGLEGHDTRVIVVRGRHRTFTRS